MLSIERILLDGAALSLGMAALIFGSLKHNPRLWLQDYPEAIRQRVAPLTDAEKRQQKMLMIPFLLLFLGLPVLSANSLRAADSALPLLTAYLHIALLLNIFNLFDAVVIDLLVLTFMKPRFASLPGTEGLEAHYRDWGLHARNFLKGVVICWVLALPLALLAAR
jgi:hypothetical protein